MNYRVGIKLLPIASFPVCTATDNRGVGPRGAKLLSIFYIVTNSRLNKPRGSRLDCYRVTAERCTSHREIV